MSSTENIVRLSLIRQAYWCRKLSPPFTSLLCATVGRELDRSSAIGRKILDWPGPPDALGDAVALRLAGGFHALVRRGDVPKLQALYPPNALPSGDALWQALQSVMTDHEEMLLAWLDHAPQTNEVGRSAVLMAGLLVIAADSRLPIALHELGSSGGLNLVLDRYGYRFGSLEYGPETPGLVLSPDWSGPPPPIAGVKVASRRGVDLNPLDVTDPADRERMIAYLWPDQPERVARAEAAIETAASDPPRIDRADAARWVDDMITPDASGGTARAVMHSIALQYFSDDNRRHIADRMAEAGAAATSDTPLYWLRFEIDPEHGNKPTLWLTSWPGGERLLAKAHPHCHWVEWLG